MLVMAACGSTAELEGDGEGSRYCLDGVFSHDGYVNAYDIYSLALGVERSDAGRLRESVPGAAAPGRYQRRDPPPTDLRPGQPRRSTVESATDGPLADGPDDPVQEHADGQLLPVR